MLWPCADIGKAEFLQKASDTDLPEIDAKPLLDDAFKVDAALTHHAVFHRIRASHEDPFLTATVGDDFLGVQELHPHGDRPGRLGGSSTWH